MRRVLIVGSGGHAKVAADIVLEMGYVVAGFLDDDPDRKGAKVLGFPVHGEISEWAQYEADAVALGVGANTARHRIMLDHPSIPWLTLIHPRATVSRFAQLGEGSMLAFGSCVGPDAVIGRGVIINTCASVDHDCQIHDFAHVAVGATLAGTVTVEEGALVGAGCSTRPGVTIGAWAAVGAGAAIVRDIPPGVTAVGVPARWPKGPYGYS
jgi:sugar O-acyltransferase (sialic acid O-acetyltransferase NeuD family)